MKKVLFTLFLIFGFKSISYSQTNLISKDTLVYCNQDSINFKLNRSFNLVTWKKLGSPGLIINDQLKIRESGLYYVYAADSTQGDTTICITTSDVNMSTIVNVPPGFIITDVIAGYYGKPITNCSNPTPGSCHFDATNIIKMGFVGKKSFQYFQGFHPDMCTGISKTLYVKLRCMKYFEDSVLISIINRPTKYKQILDTIICTNNSITYTLPLLKCDTAFIPFDTLNLSIKTNNEVSSISTKSGRLYKIKVINTVSYGGGSGNQADGAYTNITASPVENITWRLNGMQYGTLSNFRPIPNGYSPSHEYNFYLIGNGKPFVFRANDCCLGDNSGQFKFILSEIVINDQCNLNYKWSNGTNGNIATFIPSNNPYLVSLRNMQNFCVIDTFNIKAVNAFSVHPLNQTINIGLKAQFITSVINNVATYQWQSDLGNGFQNLNNAGQYSGAQNDTLTVLSVSKLNNNQNFRCIVKSGPCLDTSNLAVLKVFDNVGLDNLNIETIKVYPLPSSTQVIIDNGNFSTMGSYTAKIINSIGQQVFQSIINQQQFVINANTMGGAGLYTLYIADANNKVVGVKKIVLQ
jgi:hypothetical protein